MRATCAVTAALLAQEATAGMFGMAFPGQSCEEQFTAEGVNYATDSQVTIVDIDAEDMMGGTGAYMQAHKWGKGGSSEVQPGQQPGANGQECAPANPMTFPDNSQDPVPTAQCHRYVVTKYTTACNLADTANYPLFDAMAWPAVGVGPAAMTGVREVVQTGAKKGALVACEGFIEGSQKTFCFAGSNQDVTPCYSYSECVGAVSGTTSSAPTTTPATEAPTKAPADGNAGQCNDVPTFHAKDCQVCDCTWFQTDPSHCSDYGSHQGNLEKATGGWHDGNSACCTCGGGERPADAEPTRSPQVPVENGGVANCVDKTGTGGEVYHLKGCDWCTCDWLAHEAGREEDFKYYTGAAHVLDADGKKMKPVDACCISGGGHR